MALKLRPYNVGLLEQEINVLFQVIYDKEGWEGIYNIFTHVVTSPILIEAINKDNAKEGKPPVNFKGYLNTVTRRVLQNCINFSAYIAYLENRTIPRTPPHVLLNMKLLVYLQVLETKFIYKTLGNCLLILIDEEPDTELFDNLPVGKSPFKEVSKLYDRLLKTGANYECIDKWKNLFDKELRNIIAHNDYYFEKDTLLTPSGMTDAIKRTANPKRFTYRSDEIDALYDDAKSFNEAFYNTVNQWLEKKFEFVKNKERGIL